MRRSDQPSPSSPSNELQQALEPALDRLAGEPEATDQARLWLYAAQQSAPGQVQRVRRVSTAHLTARLGILLQRAFLAPGHPWQHASS